MKLAVFLPNWIGDVVMATPALHALRNHFAQDTIIGVMRPYVADVLSGTAFLDESILSDSQGITRGIVSLSRRLRQQNIDLALLFTNSWRTGLASWLGGCNRRVGYARDGRSWMLTDRVKPLMGKDGNYLPSPVLEAYNRLAEQVGTPPPGYRLRLEVTAEDDQQADAVWNKFEMSIHRPVVLLNPGAAFGAAKHWPAHHFARLARMMVDRLDAQVLVLCGPSERDLAQLIVQLTDRSEVHSLAEVKPSLGLTKACVNRADLLITTDSGPRHFAAAFGRPVVTLFGPTHQAWSDTYYAGEICLQRELDCGPCQQRVCPLKGESHHRCMEELRPEEVFAAAMKLLNGTSPLRLLPETERRRAS